MMRGYLIAAGLVTLLIALLALTGPKAGAQSASASQPGAASRPVNKNLAHLTDFNVVELRRYTINDGERDNFARYFETYFPDAFQQQGAIIFGQFVDEGKTNAFTWLRGFHNTDDRAKINAGFYYGPLWKERADTMNSRLIDHTNVLLLKPLRPERAIPVLPVVDPVRESAGAQGIVVMQIFSAKAGGVDELAAQAEPAFARYRAAGVREAGVLATLDVVNNFPQLPFRTDGPYLVWLGIAKDKQMVERFKATALQSAKTLADGSLLRAAPETVVLQPTPRSRLRWLAE